MVRWPTCLSAKLNFTLDTLGIMVWCFNKKTYTNKLTVRQTSAGSSSETQERMIPISSSRNTCGRQGDGDRFTCFASSIFEIRELP